MRRVKVLVADDHPLIIEGLRKVLSEHEDIEIVGHAITGEDAVRMSSELVPDVVLMDIRMPGLDGVEATRRILQQLPATKVIILTVYEDNDHLFNAIKAGAVDYKLKDTSPEELVEAVRLVARGETLITPEIAMRMKKEFDKIAQEASPYLKLTPREKEVLDLVAKGASNKEIAHQLCIEEKTVKNHMSNIFAKLHVNDRTQALIVAIRQGLVQL
ncbi:MAG: response regulator [Armatimonadota bacterium]